MNKKVMTLIAGVLAFSSFLALATNVKIINPTRNLNAETNTNSENVLVELDITGIAYGHELLWKANTTGTNYEESAVAYTDGIAYIGSCSTHGQGHDELFAVNATNGSILWSTFTGPGYAGPVIDQDVLYFGSCSHGNYPADEYMFSFNRLTGAQNWKKQIYSGIAEPILFDDTKLYFCSFSHGAKTFALNKTDGSIDWTHDSGLTYCANVPMLKDNAVYAAFYNPQGKLFKLNANDGSEIWSTSLPSGPWDNSITADGKGRIFLAIYYGKTMNAYSEANGDLLWSYPLHGGPLSFNAYHDGVVFIADTAGYVYALNSTTGTLIWENKIGSTVDIASPTLSGGLLFIGTRDFHQGAFFALDEVTGKTLWKYTIGASVTAPPSVADGMMLCGADDWNMYAFDFGVGSGDWLFHRYDRLNTAYSPYGLTEWQYVKANCTTNGNITTCTVVNHYDHDVTKVKLEAGFNAYWYDSEGNLLTSGSDSHMIDFLASSSAKTFLISKSPLQDVDIVKPINAVYWMNKEIFPFFFPVIIGPIDIEVDVRHDSDDEINLVEFYIDNELKGTDVTAPYSWTWHECACYKHTIKVITYDKTGANGIDETTVWKIF